MLPPVMDGAVRAVTVATVRFTFRLTAAVTRPIGPGVAAAAVSRRAGNVRQLQDWTAVAYHRGWDRDVAQADT